MTGVADPALLSLPSLCFLPQFNKRVLAACPSLNLPYQPIIFMTNPVSSSNQQRRHINRQCPQRQHGGFRLTVAARSLPALLNHTLMPNFT